MTREATSSELISILWRSKKKYSQAIKYHEALNNDNEAGFEEEL